MRKGLRGNLTGLFLLLSMLVIIVWIVFYFIMSRQIYSDAKERVEFTAEQIVNNLSAELANMERVSFLLSRDEDVTAFVSETDASIYFALADNIAAQLEVSRYNPAFVGHVLLYNESGEVYRFSGKLSNVSCSRVNHLTSRMELPEHLVTQLDNTNYIGYASAIYDDYGQQTGTLAMLIEEERILELIAGYAPEQTLLAAIAARGEIIAANTDSFPDQDTTSGYLVRQHVLLTPFDIIVAADEQVLDSSTRYFTIAAVMTAVIFVLLLVLFVRQLNRRFISPMLRVMNEVEAMDVDLGHHLPATDSEEFDRLIDTINDMLSRLGSRNKALQAAELRTKNAELQRQKAMVFSLKKQINAHFTVNTLNTIQILVEQGEIEQARKMTSNLSSLIRYAYNENEMIGVWDELQMIRNYITIMNIRYQGKITASFDVDDHLMDAKMPRMLLQPIVENAIVHAFKDFTEGCEIQVSAEQRDKGIVISIQDNGHGMDSKAIAALRERLETDDEDTPAGIERIALVNIRRQIASYYGDEGALYIDSAPDTGTVVTVFLPAK